jgi:molecular chaperone DnaK
MTDPIIGIDLGTTFSAVAHMDANGRPEIIANPDGARTTPSVVYFEPGGPPIVGMAARNVALSDPERTVSCIKREMGNPSYRFNLDGKELLPEAISAVILRQLKSDAEGRLGTPVERAVISVPAYFKDSQRMATKSAGELAGLDVVATINEPTAAAVAYGLGKGESDQTVLVYDFGGGTFDVTVLRIDHNEFTVLATDGDSGLGGVDIDNRLTDYLAEQFLDQRGIDLRTDPYSRLDLTTRAEQAKKDLSARQSVMVTLSSGTAASRVDLDRDRLGELIGDLIERTRVCMARAMDSAHLSWTAIDNVLLVGGSTRIAAVRDMIRQTTGKELALDVNPDEAVACGAAIRATLADLRESSNRSEGIDRGGETEPTLSPEVGIVVRDVATHSLGVRAFNDEGKPVNSIILPRFTELPCERRRTYATRADNQAKIEVEILQGDDPDPFSPAVESIGRLVMADLPQRPAGQVLVSLTLRYDVDGVVEVEAEELIEGRRVREQLMRKSGELDADVMASLRRDLDSLGDAAADDYSPEPGHSEADDRESADAGGPSESVDEDGRQDPDTRSYHSFLGVEPTASREEIEAAVAESEAFWSARRDEAADDQDREIAAVALGTLADARALLLGPADEHAERVAGLDVGDVLAPAAESDRGEHGPDAERADEDPRD